jgi:hypothetical protein
MDKKQELIDVLTKTRIFTGNLAHRLSKKHGTASAKPFQAMCATLDELIRSARDSVLIDEVLDPASETEVVMQKTAQKTGKIKLKKRFRYCPLILFSKVSAAVERSRTGLV